MSELQILIEAPVSISKVILLLIAFSDLKVIVLESFKFTPLINSKLPVWRLSQKVLDSLKNYLWRSMIPKAYG